MAEYVDNFSDLEELDVGLYPDDLDEKFEAAAAHLPKLLMSVDHETLLNLYAYYKQGKVGDCNVAKPSWYDFKSCAKWEAWKRLKNMSQEKAKTLYVENIMKIDPNFDSPEDKNIGWIGVSTLREQAEAHSGDKNIVDYIKEHNRDKVWELLESIKVGHIDKLDENGLALIHWAADIGSNGIISDLLVKGADVNAKDSDGQTALHYAASCGHADCVEFLIAKRAAVDIRDNDGSTALDVANEEEMKALLSRFYAK